MLVSQTLALVAAELKPGAKGSQIDKLAEEFIRDNGAAPGFKGYNGFPSTLCISINEAVVHGIPTDYEFTDQDIVSVDCGVYKNEFFGDAAYTFVFDGVDQKTVELCEVTKTSLYKGIEQAQVGKRIGDIGHAIQMYTEKLHGYSVVRELVGHGLGRNLHEPPEVPNYGKRGRGTVLKKGLVIAIEPMINMGKKSVRQTKDGWTIVTKDKLPSAHYEHTVAVMNGKADILSNHDIVEKEIKNNANIKDISLKN